jgi:hypothetical protein
MEGNRAQEAKGHRTFDSAYSFSFSIAVGLLLFIGGLVISLTFGNGNTVGLIFGIPLLIAGLVLPLIMMRDLFSRNEISGNCPYCSLPIKTASSTLRLECPGCGRVVGVRNMELFAADQE